MGVSGNCKIHDVVHMGICTNRGGAFENRRCAARPHCLIYSVRRFLASCFGAFRCSAERAMEARENG